MALVFGEPIDTFLPFFAVSFPIWQAVSNFISEAAYANEKTHRYLDFPRVSGSIVHLVSGLSFVIALLLRAVAALLVIAAINPHVLVHSNYPAAVIGILLLGATLMTWAIPIAYLFDRVRLLRSFLSQMLLAVYIITPVLWQPDRLKSHRWIIDWNPVFYLMELVRSPMLDGGLFSTSVAVSLVLILAGLLISWLLFPANRRLVIYQWMA
jgi:lipopolysaccharide transport system permease protein